MRDGVRDTTAISWTHWPGRQGRTVNPLRGCSRVSDGCRNCYAERLAARFSGHAHGGPAEDASQPFYNVIGEAGGELRWNNQVELHPEKLDEARRWTKPATVFVGSMSDLFHVSVPDAYIDRVVRLAWERPQDIYLSLTKRAERMGAYWSTREAPPNWWQGVSVEDQTTAHQRLPHLVHNVARSFVSFEPFLINRIAWPEYLALPRWAILGGESGPGRREMHLAGMIELATWLHDRGVAVYVKQDSGARPEQQGRIPDDIWALKELPMEAYEPIPD